MSSECQRSVLSCSRCRKRKTKCDRRLPSCSQCTAAKTECTGFSVTASSAEVPRSVVRHLEYEIARLETELAQAGHLDALNGADILLQLPSGEANEDEIPDFNELRPQTIGTSSIHGERECPSIIHELAASSGHSPGCLQELKELPAASPVQPLDPLTQSIILSRPIQSMISATLPQGPGLTDLVSRVRMGLTPSSASAVVQSSISNDITRSLGYRAALSIPPAKRVIENRVLKSMPSEIVLSLTQKYAQKVLPQYPFFHENALLDTMKRVQAALHAQQLEDSISPELNPIGPSYDLLILYLILAISVTLGSTKGGHESRCMTLSASLFEEGSKHFSSEMTVPSDLAGLQLNLLMLLYATINPRAANVWILSGAVMRSCLELGLHRESLELAAQDAMTTELRRRLFWSAYCMDRSICSALQRPLSIPDAAINTHFPSAYAESDPRLPSLGVIYYHQLLSEMVQVHFQGEALGEGVTWEAWVAGMEGKLRGWYEESCTEAGNNELVEFALSRGLMLLHRPSPRTPMPSQQSLLNAFEAAASSARSHKDHILNGFFRRPWISAHHTLESAIVLLFCLRHACATISQKFNAGSIFEMSKLFTANFLAIASQGWSEVSNYAGVYERLLGSLLEAVFSPSKDPQEHFGTSQDAELTRLLYPGPAHLEKLRFGRTLTEENSPFDFSLFNFDQDLLGFDGMPTNVTNGADVDFTPNVDFFDHNLGFDDLGLIF
ncbi:fungal-specific transcription factor domain-containing protein [Lophiotrema nucula]|uniref:Fungal-specific transcription factor domain-containing protein n=1 Tax=Lophiotrema nucula TaxID=690887 RepID=A0A6A5YFA8_9PLEO|nr:fungal-specific transcription factor domain-containing protein [Lophiotrema nucula]